MCKCYTFIDAYLKSPQTINVVTNATDRGQHNPAKEFQKPTALSRVPNSTLDMDLHLLLHVNEVYSIILIYFMIYELLQQCFLSAVD